jgi:hypothetical protein
MRNRVQIENIEEMRRRQGIDDVELHEDIRMLIPGDLVRVSLVTSPTSFETLCVRITSVKGPTFRGKLASRPHSKPLAWLRVGSPVAFCADHIHSIPKAWPDE